MLERLPMRSSRSSPLGWLIPAALLGLPLASAALPAPHRFRRPAEPLIECHARPPSKQPASLAHIGHEAIDVLVEYATHPVSPMTQFILAPGGGAIAQRLIARICSAAAFTQTFGPPS